MKKWRRTVVAVCVAALAPTLVAPSASAQEGSWFRPAVGSKKGVVTSVSKEASSVGVQVLNAGGNAVDAAVATAAALGVTRPDLCGLGSEGGMLIRRANGELAALDFIGTTAKNALPSTLPGPAYDQDIGHAIPTVPGVLAGYAAAVSAYGTKPLASLLAPAESLARDGVVVTWDLAGSMLVSQNDLLLYPEIARTYLLAGAPYPPGSILVQPDLANTLRNVMTSGVDYFYKGPVAQAIADDMATAALQSQLNPMFQARFGAGATDPGLMTYDDVASYRPIWRKPASTTYRNKQVFTMPAPYEGGVSVLEMLNILEGYDLRSFGHSSANQIHVLAEANKLAYADFAYAGDPAYTPDYTATLTSKTWGDQRRARIDMTRAQDFPPGGMPKSHTAHISVIDEAGDAVALTCSEGSLFGSKVLVPHTGIVLNSDGFFGSPINVNQPDRPMGGNRTTGILAPTIVVDKKGPVLVTGVAGGDRIPVTVVQTILNTVDFGMDIAHAVDAERITAASWSKVPLAIEDARVPQSVLDDLRARGHEISTEGEYTPFSNAQVATISALGNKYAASDPRQESGALAQDCSDCSTNSISELTEAPPYALLPNVDSLLP